MRSRLLAIPTLLLILFGSLPPAHAITPKLTNVKTFSFALGAGLTPDNITKLAAYDLVVVDGINTSSSELRALRAQGALVLGYLSIGTIEKDRWWYREARPYKLDLWGDWGEWYAAVDRVGFQNLITQKVLPRILRRGFDGVFLDNVDMIQTHRKQRSGMYTLVKAVAIYSHRRSKLVFSQNGENVTARVVKYLDGWNREDVSLSYDFDRGRYVINSARDVQRALDELTRMKARGVFTTAVDYIGTEEPALVSEAVARACAAGALPFVSDIELTRLPAAPYGCLKPTSAAAPSHTSGGKEALPWQDARG